MSDGISIPPRNSPRYTEHEVEVSNLDVKATIDANTSVSEASPSYSPVPVGMTRIELSLTSDADLWYFYNTVTSTISTKHFFTRR